MNNDIVEELENCLALMPYEYDKAVLRRAIEEIKRLNEALSKYPYNDSMLKRID
jgi:hypothetical protein